MSLKLNYSIIDTNILMAVEDYSALVESLQSPLILFEVLSELDGLKSAQGTKGFQARRAIRKIKENYKNFIFSDSRNFIGENSNQLKTDDVLIEVAKKLQKENNEPVLYTNDISMELKALSQGIKVENYYSIKEVGLGHKTVNLSEKEDDVILYLSSLGRDLEIGEYLIVMNYERLHSVYIKTGETSYDKIDKDISFGNNYGKIFAKDPYQLIAMDAMLNQQLVVLTGKAGTGKTLLALSKLLMDLETGEIDKIVIFTNPTKAKGSEELGFYSGDRQGKLLQNSIGGILASKLGSMAEVERLLLEEKIVVIPMSDIRGYEVSEHSALFISEAQNAQADLLQLAIQRVSSGQAIIEGDPFTQLDHWSYGGENNGMLKMIEVFKSYKGMERFDSFAHVHLNKIYRSEIAERASLMTSDDILE